MVDKLSVKTATIDTLIISAVVFVASVLLNAAPLRCILIFCLVMAMIEMFVTSGYTDTGHRDQGVVISSIMMIVLMLAICLVAAYRLEWKQYVLCLGLIMASDAGGLIFGRLFGSRQPFFSRKLSPNKTWAGYLGEWLTTWSLGWIGIYILGLPFSGPNICYVCLGFVICAIGDLFGSGAKREMKIKHSSDYMLNIPVLGKLELLTRSRHGFLDCMDSASFAIIFFILLQNIGRL